MRIVAGAHRGRILSSPDGLETRPTSDRVRESVFNVLRHAKWLDGDVLDGALVLDAFAGTGALGLEALSQGAAHAAFMENGRPALAACRENIATLKEAERTAVLACDALKPPPRPASVEKRTLVFLDPPYGHGWGIMSLTALKNGGWLADDAVVVMEMAKKKPEDTPPGFSLQDERAYGVALIRFLKFTA